MRFGEDIDFSIRIFKAGCRCRLFPESWVWHKRRTDFRKFFRQVYNSGIARINLYKKYPESLKLVHLLPMVFTVGVILLVLTSAVGRLLMHYDDNRPLVLAVCRSVAANPGILRVDIHRCHKAIPQRQNRWDEHRRRLRAADGIWMRIPFGMVETLRVGPRRVPGF